MLVGKCLGVFDESDFGLVDDSVDTVEQTVLALQRLQSIFLENAIDEGAVIEEVPVLLAWRHSAGFGEVEFDIANPLLQNAELRVDELCGVVPGDDRITGVFVSVGRSPGLCGFECLPCRVEVLDLLNALHNLLDLFQRRLANLRLTLDLKGNDALYCLLRFRATFLDQSPLCRHAASASPRPDTNPNLNLHGVITLCVWSTDQALLLLFYNVSRKNIRKHSMPFQPFSIRGYLQLFNGGFLFLVSVVQQGILVVWVVLNVIASGR